MSEPVNSVDGLATQFMVTHILSFIPYSIFYYDYFLTLSDEVELFWLRPNKFNLFSSFFLLNRYVSLFGNLQILIFGIIGRIDFMLPGFPHIPYDPSANPTNSRRHFVHHADPRDIS
ncbi:hypothetical protein BJY52DRAFT_69315 [Lactarius psammicola]|nr:hypothetical protein BJY52DRAFT_69315 [Lactarius psammicola]